MFPYKELEDAIHLDIAASASGPVIDYITSDMSIQQIRCTMLSRSLFKKLSPVGNSQYADNKALEKFNAINASCSTEPFEFPADSEQDSLFFSYFLDNIRKTLTPGEVNFDLAYMRETFATGPGASLGCDNESFYSKLFTSQLSATHPYLLSLYRAVICESDTWSEAERLRNDKFGFTIKASNRLFFVPKTAEISRTCCTEPPLNMMFQKSLGHFLEYCLRTSFGISLTTQPDYNRELARIGSIDGSFGTIDLVSASDSILWSLCKRIIPENLLGFFRLFRCESTILPDGSEVPLNMISTMGNGFTFPLQTIIFACAVRSVYQLMGFSSSCPRTQFGVFGDDIIVNKQSYDYLVRMLTKLGFTVNDTKSFNTGPFRESCGYDWYNGFFVRSIYLRSLETVSDVYSAINRLNRWSALSGVRLPNAISLLRSSARRKELRVPVSEQIDCGIQVPFVLSKPVVDNNYWFLYRKLVKVVKKRQVPDNLEDSISLGYRFYNPYGWGVSYLGGYARREEVPLNPEASDPLKRTEARYPRGFMTLRTPGGELRTAVRRQSIPWWDWPGAVETQDRGYEHEAYIHDPWRFFSYDSWKAAVTANM